LEYAGASASADQLAFDVTVGDAHQHYVLGRTPGTRRDTLEVTFQNYLKGERLLVDATASSAGQQVGYGHAQAALAPSCTALAMALATAAAGDDGGQSLPDGDVAPPSDGMSVRDLAMVTTQTMDLTGVIVDMSLPTVTTIYPESITPNHPNGNKFTEYNDECPSGTGIIGFQLQVQTDAGGAPVSISRTDPVCADFEVAPNGFGWTVHWGNRQVMIGRGIAGQKSVEYLCKPDQYVVGFAGRETTYLTQLKLSCAPITINPDRTGVNVGPTVDDPNGVGGPGGDVFNPIYCPPWKVATHLRTDQQAGMPFDAFGIGCKQVSSQ
jgi:hypothetical protein